MFKITDVVCQEVVFLSVSSFEILKDDKTYKEITRSIKSVSPEVRLPSDHYEDILRYSYYSEKTKDGQERRLYDLQTTGKSVVRVIVTENPELGG